ncbi:RSP_2648 family PIN domain-containing protein [Pseudoruegeria sp. SK021]|uniref:RSP_2648 family PIN domain-containing protein n=1 Tax=Pseudoruegeria sp. SK021 TaxID=1933035 RepID=UPI000A24D7DA|nr:PIN domain-containing protein [Pseudoruegeria sp. SK021]OSP55246.1 hypothetical protein BV911_08440 [Pseudoruegeria sp. SK021]
MRVVLDACVLYPTVLRQILIGVAEAGLIVPLWSERILGEWRRAVLRTHPADAAQAGVEIALLQAQFPAACVAADPDIEARLSLPDDNDRHVLATAIVAEADALVTLNMRDFPGRTLARDGILPRHPDGLLLELYTDEPVRVLAVVAGVMAAMPDREQPDQQRRHILKRAGLPRFGKALAQTFA